MLNKEDGGLGLVNIRVKHESLLCNWIIDCDKHEKIHNLAKYYLGETVEGGLIWKFNLSFKDSKKYMPGHSFWHSLLHMWHGYNHHSPQSKVLVNNQIIANNSCIKIGGVVVRFVKTHALTIAARISMKMALHYHMNPLHAGSQNVSCHGTITCH